MAKKKSAINVIGIVFAALVLVGLVLTIVGMCIGIVSSTLGKETTSIGLSHETWDVIAKAQEGADKLNTGAVFPSRTFTVIAFVVTLVGAVLALADTGLKAFGKKINLLGFIAGGVTVIGAILILVAGLVLAGQFQDYNPLATNSAGAGIWLGFIGGLVAGVACILSSLKIFNK